MSRRTRLLTCALIAACLLMALNYKPEAAADLSAKEARRLIARVAGIELPSDAVRVKEVSSLGSSAVVTAQVET
ncbi:MAG TPA: hypothetical protein VF634_06195, partial [Pyrinomonadaceae bacterium]